jgi:hypothetical protein
MFYQPTRRHFLKSTATAGAALGFANLPILSHLPLVSAAEAKLDARVVRLQPDIEPLVRLIEETPREKLLEEIAARIHRGLSYREILTALLLAGVRNIQPRPVGFKFHAVLVVNSAHLASLSSPDADRWLPIFWALDYFKVAQAEDAHAGDWTMLPLEESKVPASQKAKAAFIRAMDDWDEAAADTAIAGVVRTAGAQEVFEMLCRYGARDFREIGHKAIYVANAWRTLQAIGWQHAEPVLRSLAYALLDRGGDKNPAHSDLPADRPWRQNEARAKTIRSDWMDGKPSEAATAELLHMLRQASPDEASQKVVEILNRGIAVRSIFDAFFSAAGELLMRRPGILSLHAVTSTNALHFAFQTSAKDETRRMLVLQNAAFLTLFRGDADKLKSIHLDELQAARQKTEATPDLEEIFADVSGDRMTAARKVLAYATANPEPGEFINMARRLIFLKGRNSHDYKFSSAVLEDYHHLSAAWRPRYLAASVFNLRGSQEADNELVIRSRAALGV